MVEPDRANQEPGAKNEARTGQLSYERRVADVLKGIAKSNPEHDVVLNLRSPNGFTSGDLLISQSAFIEGASCDKSKMQGYPAARKLLMLTFGEYGWKVVENGNSDHIERNLHLNIHAIIPRLPFLPEDMKDFFDESSLLDKIFKPRKWSTLINVNAVMDFLFEPDVPKAPAAEIKPSMRAASMTLTSVKAVKAIDQGIKVPRVLRERLYKGTSLAHTIERNFGTTTGANAKRLQHRQSSFKFSRASNSAIPIYVSIFVALILSVSGALWLMKNSSTTSRNAAHGKVNGKEATTHRTLKHQKGH